MTELADNVAQATDPATVADLTAAALRLRAAVANPTGFPGVIDPAFRRHLLRALEVEFPALFEAIGDVIVCVTPPPSLDESRRLHPSSYCPDSSLTAYGAAMLGPVEGATGVRSTDPERIPPHA